MSSVLERAVSNPSYEDVISFYLRDDVSDVLWRLSQRRQLRFFYHAKVDFRQHGAKARSIRLHCEESIGSFRDRIKGEVQSCGESASPFFPFFNMGVAANSPGVADQPTGWDMRFEFDFDLAASFRALIPVVGLFEHFGVPYLAKFSGHRSLHVILPAEAFPLKMRVDPVQSDWMRLFERLGRLLGHLAPALTRTGASHLAKDLVLTAPYSFHRYHGLVSLPVTLGEAMDFDPASAAFDRLDRLHWFPDSFDERSEAIRPLLDELERFETNPDAAVELAREVFSGDAWIRFAERSTAAECDDDAVMKALMDGLPGIALDPSGNLAPAPAERLEKAVLVLDSASAKASRFRRLIAHTGFVTPLATELMIRRAVAAGLAIWVEGGLPRALEWLLGRCVDTTLVAPIAFATRFVSLLPEEPGTLNSALQRAWCDADRHATPRSLFILLALAELASRYPDAMEAICWGSSMTDESRELRDAILVAGPWRTEQHPNIAVMALRLGFGLDAVDEWLSDPEGAGQDVVRGVFGGDVRKFAYSAGSPARSTVVRSAPRS